MSQRNTTSPASSRRLPAQIAIVAVALTLLTWRAWPDGKLRVIFPETQGDAALIQTPGGAYILIDGGSDPAALAAALGRSMPFWQRKLAAVVLTNADQRHLPAQVAALERYDAEVALAPAIHKRGATIDAWRQLLGERQTPIRLAQPNARLQFGDVRLEVLAANAGDESGMLLRLDYGTTSVVFDHSAGAAEEETVLRGSVRAADLLVFPWERDPHTSIVTALGPRALVLTDGQEADRPAEQTFVERSIGGAKLYHERLDGTITWVSDGVRSWVETERPREQP